MNIKMNKGNIYVILDDYDFPYINEIKQEISLNFIEQKDFEELE